MFEAQKLNRIAFVILIFALCSSPAAATEWRVVKEESHIAFHGSMLGVAVTGYFTRFESLITFDPDNLQGAYLSIIIDMTAVDTAHDERDTALKLPEWFAVQSHAVATFTARKFRRTGSGTYEAAGSLTVKGISKRITLPFSLAIDGNTALVSGAVDLNRRDFNIGEGEWASDKLVAFDVRVDFEIAARRTAPE